MSENILVCTAWPYANGSIHIGHVAGCYLPADIFARFHRLIGNTVIMVSGSDAHGTPVTITAETLGVTQEDLDGGKEIKFLATRIPSSSAGSTVVLKVKINIVRKLLQKEYPNLCLHLNV